MEKTPTGIPGLDEMLDGGIPRNYTVLVTGGAGTGKSTFGMQFLVKGLEEYGENGLYITFEERPKDIIRNFSQFGWDVEKIRIVGILPQKSSFISPAKYIEKKSDKKNYFEYTPRRFSVDIIRDTIIKHVEEVNAKRVVIDSVTALAFFLSSDLEIRQEILGLINLLSELEVTSLILSEKPEGKEGISRFGVEEFLAHGVIILYNIVKGSERVRGIEVFKMRGVNHSKKICLMEIGPNGIEVYPTESLYRDLNL